MDVDGTWWGWYTDAAVSGTAGIDGVDSLQKHIRNLLIMKSNSRYKQTNMCNLTEAKNAKQTRHVKKKARRTDCKITITNE